MDEYNDQIVTSVMLSIFERAGVVPLVVVNEPTFPLSEPLSL